METTSIKLHKETVQQLKDAKQYPRETYDDIIKRLLKNQEKEE